MSIKERRERDFARREQAILDAAVELASREGWDSVTIRKVADRIEYSAPTLYEHFETKQAILMALVRRGFGDLGASLTPAAKRDPPDFEAMIAAYWQFARDHAAVYELMSGLPGIAFGVPDAPEEARAVFALMRRVLSAALGKRADDVDGKVDVVWALLHGMIGLERAGRMAGGARRARKLTEDAVATLLAAWRKKRK